MSPFEKWGDRARTWKAHHYFAFLAIVFGLCILGYELAALNDYKPNPVWFFHL